MIKEFFNLGIATLFITQIAIISISAQTQKKERPNIIFLLTDDQHWDTFGFMGHGYIKTPNCDMLASKGIVFNNAYHAAPIIMK